MFFIATLSDLFIFRDTTRNNPMASLQERRIQHAPRALSDHMHKGLRPPASWKVGSHQPVYLVTWTSLSLRAARRDCHGNHPTHDMRISLRRHALKHPIPIPASPHHHAMLSWIHCLTRRVSNARLSPPKVPEQLASFAYQHQAPPSPITPIYRKVVLWRKYHFETLKFKPA